MSLTPQQEDATRNELKQNFELANVTLDQVAADLSATSEHVQNVMQLDADRIEEPWILKAYFDSQIIKAGGQPIPYSALVGNPEHYWFLNGRFIKKGKLVE
ncbi:DUF2316 family protein [Lentilactobacillus kisonensis]|uniref:DUF2316 domain-containing protein n=2 Tax=Lentilactobacillus kisonensis TaxID=481722 RepID=H1LHC6_9LACO|nr:DUF2316 family protein [Lentilactobacillus kisonensis]EHO50478.1 hypothetical protein HMPREF9104_02016 [Lentilactobacillus kisonensis F0435]KRL20279.1 hypothetical protein FC98_GL001783 [Lentilactobacillus kisonensis DSM 19906 = JCM 15041]